MVRESAQTPAILWQFTVFATACFYLNTSAFRVDGVKALGAGVFYHLQSKCSTDENLSNFSGAAEFTPAVRGALINQFSLYRAGRCIHDGIRHNEGFGFVMFHLEYSAWF